MKKCGPSEDLMVMRSVYLQPEMDDKLRKLAFVNKVSKNELIRQMLEKSLEGIDVDAMLIKALESQKKKKLRR